ncbi:hypothetical protein GF342_05230 [Candidatus Woesearchaeota archaeon]|nr:hypothetical protein [Candidatus Woesearchaeota archaeon]
MTKELIAELEHAIAEYRKRTALKASFEELEEIFFLRDFVQQEGYVSSRLGRTLTRRVANLFWNWNNYLHNLIMPNPSSMIMVSESQMLSEQEKADIIHVMNTIMDHVTVNTLLGLEPDEKKEAQWIDESVKFWREVVSPQMHTVVQKIGEQWHKKAAQPEKPERFET